MRRVLDLFQLFDTDRSHSIDEDELRVLLLAFGIVKTQEEVATLALSIGEEGSITFESFKAWVQQQPICMHYIGLTVDGLYALSREVNQPLSLEECHEIMHYCDRDKDGVLSMADYEWMEDFIE